MAKTATVAAQHLIFIFIELCATNVSMKLNYLAMNEANKRLSTVSNDIPIMFMCQIVIILTDR